MIEKFVGKSQDPDGLDERKIEDDELLIHTSYCLICPCGKFRRAYCGSDGQISFTCDRAGKYEPVYIYPLTGKRYQKSVLSPYPKQETSCEMQVVCTYEETRLVLKDMLVIPEGWTLEVEDDSDYGDHLDLDMDLNLCRIPDPIAYQQWMQDIHAIEEKAKRDKEIERLQKRLNELTGKTDV